MSADVRQFLCLIVVKQIRKRNYGKLIEIHQPSAKNFNNLGIEIVEIT